MKRILSTIAITACCYVVYGQKTDINNRIKNNADKISASHYDIYTDLHKNPELSLMEVRTAAKMAAELREMGFEVTTGVGGNGVVGILKNGKGKTIMLRTDMDALPVKENTGLTYASEVYMKNAAGIENPVMHACGHDMHMATWLECFRHL
jgi:hippurate hydrolase